MPLLLSSLQLVVDAHADVAVEFQGLFVQLFAGMVFSLSNSGDPLTSHLDMGKWVASGALQEIHRFLRQTAVALQRRLLAHVDMDILIALGQQTATAVDALAVAATTQLKDGSLADSLRVLHAEGAVAALHLAPAALQHSDMVSAAALCELAAAIAAAAVGSNPSPAALAALEEMGLVDHLLRKGFGTVTAAADAARSKEDSPAELVTRVLAAVESFVILSVMALIPLLTNPRVALQLAALWQPAVAALCKALPPDVLQPLVPHLLGISKVVRTAARVPGPPDRMMIDECLRGVTGHAHSNLRAVLSGCATVQLPWTLADTSRSQLRQRLQLQAAAARKQEGAGAPQDTAAAMQQAALQAGVCTQASCKPPAMAGVQRAAVRCPLTLQGSAG